MHHAIQAGRVAVITGAAAGIGNAIAVRLAAQDMILLLCDRNEQALRLAAIQLRLAHPGVRIYTLAGDVSDAGFQQALHDQAVLLGDIGLLVNNAGILGGGGPWETSARWREVMEINFWSVLQLQHLFVPRLMAQSCQSAVVNVGSKEGITTPPGNAAYNVSKAALKVLTEQLAHELREAVQDKVRAHLLIPGYTFTPMNFPNTAACAPKPAAPWTADQVAQRMLERMQAGDFYLFCEDNEVTPELDRRRMQWAADDLILNRPALSRWHPDYRDRYAAYVSGLQPTTPDQSSSRKGA